MSVALVGAGPGDPGLLTVRARELIERAQVIVHDALGTEAALGLAHPDAERIDAGKRAGDHTMTQAEINRALIEHARAGKRVVRLKGGDPFVFGRGGEEAEALAAAGIGVEVVPGISSAIAAAALAGIPVTHRGTARTFAVATGHDDEHDWDALARIDTLVFLMGARRIERIARALTQAGRAPKTPAAVVQDASLASQRTVTGTLGTIAARAAGAGIRAPAVLIVGDVVTARAPDLRDLAGVRVLVTHEGRLAGLLRARGATVTEAPVIRIAEPSSFEQLDAALAILGDHDWVAFTSGNGVRATLARLRAAGRDARAFAGARIAAVGPGTAEALADAGLRADLVPPVYTAAGLGAAFPSGRGRVLAPRAARASEDLDRSLAAKGWTVEPVTAYRTVAVGSLAPGVLSGEHDVATFASASAVRSFAHLAPADAPRTAAVCIGPSTAVAARAAGLPVAAVAAEHTLDGLVTAVVSVTAGRRRSA